MTDDTITPDRLRLAGWDDRFACFTREGREGDFWVILVAGAWLWCGIGGPTKLTGMADVAARLATMPPV